MRLELVARFGAVLALLAALIVPCAPALAATQLSGIAVVPAQGGAVRVVLSFIGGGVPPGWTVTGAGTQTPVVVLPATSQAPTMQPAYAGTGAVSSLAIAPAPNGLTVTLRLTSAVQISSRAVNGAIFIDLAAPQAATPATPAPAYIARTSSGDIGNGQAYEIVPLKYADVSEVVGLLVQGQQVTPNDVFNPEGSIFSLPTSSNGIPTQSGSPFSSQGPSQPTSFGERVNDSIGYDRRLNAIILYGSPQQIAQYKNFIAAIDVPVPSVMLECEVIELDETHAKNLGIDFTNGAGGPIGTGSAVLGPTAANGFGAPAITAQLQAQLFATIENGGGKILATPRVLAVNGAAAQILSGDALPIISTTVIGGTSPITQTSVNYIAVGINMQIQPRIDVDGYVTSHIFAEVSSVTQYVQVPGQQVPQVSLRQVSTQATVADGQAFVVGGLLKDEEITSLAKIPGIGDLPLIGGFFRVRHDTTQRTNLYIFITPHIIQKTGFQNERETTRQQLPRPDVPGPMPYSKGMPPPATETTPRPGATPY